MRFAGRATMMLASVALWGTVGGASVFAQTCGDADGSGSVTVTDGVQVLRSAAGLSSACTTHAASCDIDGSGTATLTDGVNVLRKAAGITITEACPSGDGTADVAKVTDGLVPFLTFALREVPNVSIGSAGGAVRPAATEDCEDGGTRTTSQAGITVGVTFNGCKVSETGIGHFQLDGTIQVSLGLPATVAFELNLADLDNGTLFDFDGTIQGTPRAGGGFVVDGGPINVSRSEGGPAIFRLTFNDLTVDGDGHLISGSVEAEDQNDNFELQSAELEVEDGSNTATVHVVRDDATEQDYQLNLTTGDLTPVG